MVVLGSGGLVGSACVRLFRNEGFCDVVAATRQQVDLTDQLAVREYFARVRPDYVLMAAGRVGGIIANSSYPWDFIYDNSVMAANVLDACRRHHVRKVLMLGSSCIYPRLAPQPIREESLLAGALEPTNEWYAVAKIAGIKMGQALARQHGLSVIAAMPTNLYGPGDNFHPTHSHVIPGLIQRFHSACLAGAKSVEIWGSGKPRREFLHVDDLARGLFLLMKEYNDESIINVGAGEDLTIAELAEAVAQTVGFEGEIVYDLSKPDGTPRKLMDSSKMFEMGWRPQITLKEGLESAYEWFLANVALPR